MDQQRHQTRDQRRDEGDLDERSQSGVTDPDTEMVTVMTMPPRISGSP